jgi:phosphoglucosamine mutase
VRDKFLFGSSGVRGVVGKDISADSFRQLAQSVGTTLSPFSRICVATDARLSREILKKAVISGLISCDINVVDLGIVPTPALAFLTREMGFDSGIMITASHNPPQYNGMKLFNSNSLGYTREQEKAIEKIYFEKSFRTGSCKNIELVSGEKKKYGDFLKNRFSHQSLKRQWRIVVDPGNGAASGFASEIFADMGLTVLPINDYYDGNFPGRSPEPMEDTLQGTVKFLREQNADLAVCFDGDADRVVFCDHEGFLGFNEMIAFISRLVARETGKKKIATTIETGNLLDLAVADFGVKVVRGKVGDVNVAHLTRELDAALGVEGVGVYIIPEAGYYPDSIFATLTLLSQLNDPSEIREFFIGMPQLFFGKAKVSCPNDLKESLIMELQKVVHRFKATEVNTLDGLRLEFGDSWMLLRASGTEPIIRIIAESTSKSRTKTLLDEGTKTVTSCLERFKL